MLYHKGQDYGKARQWFEKAAAQGDAMAQGNLGVLYENGQGVPQDYGKARQWYEQAAAQGYAKAQVNLGVLYATDRACRRTMGRRDSGTRKPPPRACGCADQPRGAV